MKRNSVKFSLCALILVLTLGWGISAGGVPLRALPLESSAPLFDLPFDPSHLLVKFQSGISAEDHAAVLADIDGWVEWDYDQIGWQLIRYDMGISYNEMKMYVEARDLDNIRRLLAIARSTAEGKFEQLAASPRVEKADFDWYLQLFETDFNPNDPYFVDVDPVAGITTPQQWSSFDVQLPQAWDVTQGSTSVKIAIIDTGTDTDHPDLANNISRWPTGGVRGWDFVGGKDGEILEMFLPIQQDANPDIHWNDGVDDGWGLPDPSAGDGQDILGLGSSNSDLGVFHGTWTASCASAATNNSLGSAGAGFNVKIMPVRCASPEGGLPEYIFSSVSVVTMGVNWAVDNGADIISMSLGAPGLELPGLHDAIINAVNQGIPVFAASGNTGANQAVYPAAYDEVFAVGSFSQAHNRADFSTYGWFMDALAGGGQIVGTDYATAEWIWGGYVASVCDMNNGGPEAGTHGYAAAMGTSAACPQAAGIAALVLSVAPNLSPTSLYNILRQTCADVEAPGWDEEAGYGILQARSALNLVSATTNLQVTMTPQGSTIIPPGGGTLNFQVQLRNNGTQPAYVDFWTEATLPSGSNYGPLFVRYGLTLAPGQLLTRNMSQSIPGSAPAGSYVMHGYAGFCQGVIKAQGQFNFSKSGMDNSGPISNWTCSGWEDNSEIAVAGMVGTPQSVKLYQNAPNPFNPSTVLKYDLPEATFVRLGIYDASGRQVAELATGWFEAGSHALQFDGSELSSGVYLYRLQAGAFSVSGKMVLMK